MVQDSTPVTGIRDAKRAVRQWLPRLPRQDLEADHLLRLNGAARFGPEAAKCCQIELQAGFTLLEVMVALILGVLIVGGVMGLNSVSLQYGLRVQEKSRIQPVLEAAAQEILVHPEKALEKSLTLDGLPDKPRVEIQQAKVEGLDPSSAGKLYDQLHRVLLLYRGNTLEFSVIIPQSIFQ